MYYEPWQKISSDYSAFSTLSQVKKIVKKEEITIIHVHHRMAAFYTALLKKQNSRLKFFATAHNTFTDKNGLKDLHTKMLVL